MLTFLRGEADVLVCTSIIESGIDIPQANTLIVERADTFGLAQLYQIRGRVGRSPRARLRLPALSQPRGAHAGGGAAAVRAVGLHRAGRRLEDRDARPRDPRRGQPAGRRAVRPRRRAGLRALHADARRGGRAGWRRGAPRTTRPSRCASTSTSTPTSPPTTSPTSRPRSTSTAGSRRAREVAELGVLRDELEDRFGPLPEPLREPDRAPAGAHQARPGGRADGHVPRRPPGRDADRARLRPGQAPARRSPEAALRVGRSQFSVRVPGRPGPALPRRGRAPRTRCWRSSARPKTESAAV